MTLVKTRVICLSGYHAGWHRCLSNARAVQTRNQLPQMTAKGRCSAVLTIVCGGTDVLCCALGPKELGSTKCLPLQQIVQITVSQLSGAAGPSRSLRLSQVSQFQDISMALTQARVRLPGGCSPALHRCMPLAPARPSSLSGSLASS